MQIKKISIEEFKKFYRQPGKYVDIYEAIQKTDKPLSIKCADKRGAKNLGYSISQRMHRLKEFRNCKLGYSEETIYILPIDLIKELKNK